MLEPRNDMFPDPSQTEPVVSEDVTTQLPKAPKVEETKEPEATPAPKGTKTPDGQLYAALNEERAKRKEAEARLEAYEQTTSSLPSLGNPDDIYSDEGKILLNQLEEERRARQALEEKIALKDLYANNPEIHGLEAEFDEYRKSRTGYLLEDVVSLFLNDRGLTKSPVEPKGLETPTSGPKSSEPSGFTAEEIDRIRTTQPRLFIKLIRDGAIDPERIR